jgi:hypothetical protein
VSSDEFHDDLAVQAHDEARDRDDDEQDQDPQWDAAMDAADRAWKERGEQ